MPQVSRTRLLARVVKAWWRRFNKRMNSTATDVPGLENVDRVHWLKAEDGARLRVFEVAGAGTKTGRGEASPTSSAAVTIVYAHGFTLSAQSWCFQVDALRGESRVARQLIPDLRGHAGSAGGDEAAQTEVELGVDLTARDFVQMIRELAPGEKVVLVGHSLGVMTVLGALRHMTDAERQLVQGIVLANGAVDPFAARGVPRLLHLLPIRTMRAVGRNTPRFAEGFKGKVEWLIKPVIAAAVYYSSLEHGKSARYDVVDFHAQEIEDVPMHTILGYLEDLTNHDERDCVPFLKHIPGVILAGNNDAVATVEQSRVLVQQWPSAELREYDEAGHMLPVERPEDVNRAIRQLL
ncbi:alpha/beta fold hydrolase [Corynebacterium resistens]